MTDNPPRDDDILHEVGRLGRKWALLVVGLAVVYCSIVASRVLQHRLGLEVIFYLAPLVMLCHSVLFSVKFSDRGIVYRNGWGRTRSYTYDQVVGFNQWLGGQVKIFLADGREIFLRGSSDSEPAIRILDNYAPHAKTTMFRPSGL